MEPLAGAEEAAKAGAQHNNSDASAMARRLAFMRDPRVIEQRSRRFDALGNVQVCAGGVAPSYPTSHARTFGAERSSMRAQKTGATRVAPVRKRRERVEGYLALLLTPFWLLDELMKAATLSCSFFSDGMCA